MAQLILKRDATISLLIAAGLGAAIWALSPLITGVAEPWDAESPYYYVALLLAGALAGALYPKNTWVVLPGIFAGQLVYMLVFLPVGGLLVLGVFFLIGFGLLALAGAAVAAQIRKRLMRPEAGA